MQTKKSAGEKRKHPRFPVGITMDVVTKGQSVRKCRGAIADLSVGGMAFDSNTILEEGSSLYLKVNVPLEIRGEIKHIKSAHEKGFYRYGVSFHKLGYASSEASKPEHFIAAKFQKPNTRRK